MKVLNNREINKVNGGILSPECMVIGTTITMAVYDGINAAGTTAALSMIMEKVGAPELVSNITKKIAFGIFLRNAIPGLFLAAGIYHNSYMV